VGFLKWIVLDFFGCFFGLGVFHANPESVPLEAFLFEKLLYFKSLKLKA